MPKLEGISALPADAVELLEAVGYIDVSDLSKADPEELLAELVKANKVLDIMSEHPTEQNLGEWQAIVSPHEEVVEQDDPDMTPAVSDEAAEDKGGGKIKRKSESKAGAETGVKSKNKSKGKTGAKGKNKSKGKAGAKSKKKSKESNADLVNFEEDSEILEMLAISPTAESLDPALTERHKLVLEDLPDGVLLNQCEGKTKINIMTTFGRADSHLRQDEVKRTGLKASRIRNFEDLETDEHYVKPLDRGKARAEVSLSEGLNAGVEPGSRRFIRGVLHPHPLSMYGASLSSVMLAASLLANVVGIPILFIYQIYISRENMIGWLAGLFSVLLITGLCYLFFGFKARCRICGQRPLIPRDCVKHKKAHHLPGIGYILPTALQMLFHKWFYCTYCGTAVRLKK